MGSNKHDCLGYVLHTGVGQLRHMDNLQESVYTFHHVGSRDQTRVLWYRCPRSHLAGFCTSCFDKSMIRPSVYLLIDLLIPFTFSGFFSNSEKILFLYHGYSQRTFVLFYSLSIHSVNHCLCCAEAFSWNHIGQSLLLSPGYWYQEVGACACLSSSSFRGWGLYRTDSDFFLKLFFCLQ